MYDSTVGKSTNILEAGTSESKYRLIQIIDRGSLKWPSNDVIAIITLWKLFLPIESQPTYSIALSIGALSKRKCPDYRVPTVLNSANSATSFNINMSIHLRNRY